MNSCWSILMLCTPWSSTLKSNSSCWNMLANSCSFIGGCFFLSWSDSALPKLGLGLDLTLLLAWQPGQIWEEVLRRTLALFKWRGPCCIFPWEPVLVLNRDKWAISVGKIQGSQWNHNIWGHRSRWLGLMFRSSSFSSQGTGFSIVDLPWLFEAWWL